MSIISLICSHSYSYIGRINDVHMYRCTHCRKETNHPVDG